MSKRYVIDEQVVRSFAMIDRDLELILKEIGKTSPPDEILPVCTFKMIHRSSGEEIGDLNLRVGYTENVIRFRGNIGYTVFESYRGNNYSSRSCKLLVPLLRKLQLSPVWITCNVDNVPSRKCIEKIGAVFVEAALVPDSYEFARFYPPDARQKLRFRWDVM